MSVDLGPEYPKFIVDLTADSVDHEEHDAANELMDRALAEVWNGDRGCFWNGSCYENTNPVPWQILYRARELACRKMGWPYHWQEDPS